jgi:2,5-diketo-D-gluconate reductase A
LATAWGGFAEGATTCSPIRRCPPSATCTIDQLLRVVLRWLIQRDILVIPKSVRRERMEQNLYVFDFTLTEEDMTSIAAMDTGGTLFFDHRDAESDRFHIRHAFELLKIRDRLEFGSKRAR